MAKKRSKYAKAATALSAAARALRACGSSRPVKRRAARKLSKRRWKR